VSREIIEGGEREGNVLCERKVEKRKESLLLLGGPGGTTTIGVGVNENVAKILKIKTIRTETNRVRFEGEVK